MVNQRMTRNVHHAIEDNGDKVLDSHVRRVGSGRMSAVISVATEEARRDARFFHALLNRFNGLSYVTVQVNTTELMASRWQFNHPASTFAKSTTKRVSASDACAPGTKFADGNT